MLFHRTGCVIFLIILGSFKANAQTAGIHGIVTNNNKPLSYAGIQLIGTTTGVLTDNKGKFAIADLAPGKYFVKASAIGYKSDTFEVNLKANQLLSVHFSLEVSIPTLDEFVVTATKTKSRQSQAPVRVQVLDAKKLNGMQACNLAEGMNYTPGVRTETNCQTCNYTQLRINGLQGGYSQILLNGRPVFSPLLMLYGLEQIPTVMIDKIEVVRGGGSSIYGTGAVGGTVNISTKLPESNNWSIDNAIRNYGLAGTERQVNSLVSSTSKNKKRGLMAYGNYRQRRGIDMNNDGFTELPQVKNLSGGVNYFHEFSHGGQLQLSTAVLQEFRLGGQMLDLPPHQLAQAERRKHLTGVFTGLYDKSLKKIPLSVQLFAAAQKLKRYHYTGILPDDSTELKQFNALPPYGKSDAFTWQTGAQLTFIPNNVFSGKNTFVLGGEWLHDRVKDGINAYNYHINQTINDVGVFVQSQWKIASQITLLAGVRADKHNMLAKPVFSPRSALLYKPFKNAVVRLGYAKGFRAPQAFDADMHIAFAGGGVSRIRLSPQLKQETSLSYTGSISYDIPREKFITGATAEVFYTNLNGAFVLVQNGEDMYGKLFEKQNGQSAVVKGITVETRANYLSRLQAESGITFQQSKYSDAVAYSENLAPVAQFLRTPSVYGYAMLQYNVKQWRFQSGGVFTGRMKVLHFGGTESNPFDRYVNSPVFFDLNLQAGHRFTLPAMGAALHISAGIRNILNSYQRDFDTGKNRDSNFIYGPAAPRNFTFSLRMESL